MHGTAYFIGSCYSTCLHTGMDTYCMTSTYVMAIISLLYFNFRKIFFLGSYDDTHEKIVQIIVLFCIRTSSSEH
jgi:hypothetical protein